MCVTMVGYGYIVGITMLLSLTVFSLNVAKFMPTTSAAVPLLGKCLLVCRA